MKNYLRYKFQLSQIIIALSFLLSGVLWISILKPDDVSGNFEQLENTSSEDNNIDAIKEEILQIAFDPEIADEPVITVIPTTMASVHYPSQPIISNNTTTVTPNANPTPTARITTKPVQVVTPKPKPTVIAAKPTIKPKPTTRAS